MPLARRKKVLITKDDEGFQAVDPETPVYYIPQTGEIFQDYSAYVSRMSFYRLKIFQCETTGRGNLTFFEALDSERVEARMLESRFPEQLKAAVLKSVQWQMVGRLDHLVEAVYERFKDRYFEGESVFVDFATSTNTDEENKEPSARTRYWVRVVKVIPPEKPSSSNGKRKASQMENGDDNETTIPHSIYGDLKVPAAQVNAQDDPKAYTYQTQLFDEGPNGAFTIIQPPVEGDFRNGATLMNVRCDVMSRDRLAFSKSILKRFIRESVERDAAVASPWVVKKEFALKYCIAQVMPDNVQKGVDAIKRSETEKRKRISEAKENPPPAKRPKRGTKLPLTEEEKAAKAKAEEAAKAKREKDEAIRLALTGCRKAVSRWPIEDLDVVLTEKEKAAGKTLVRPAGHRVTEFEAPDMFESFLMSWNFITTYGHAFNVSPFSLDILEAALKHSTPDQCLLIDCVHSGLISSCRSISVGAVKTQAGLNSLINDYDEELDEGQDIKIGTIIETVTAYGSGWEKKAVNYETWCNALVSILKEHATLPTMPALRDILAHLLFKPDSGGATNEQEVKEQPDREEAKSTIWKTARPRERYYSLPFHHKVVVLSFLCDLSATSKSVHNALDVCEASLTEMRKEKVELKRQQKKVADQLSAFSPEKRKTLKAPTNGKGKKKGKGKDANDTPDSAGSDHEQDPEPVTLPDQEMIVDEEQNSFLMPDIEHESDVDTNGRISIEPPPPSETLASEVMSDDYFASAPASEAPATPSRAGGRTPRTSLRFKAQDQARVARQKEEPRPLTEQEEAEQKQLEEEAAKIEKNLETLELEFRQYLLLSRLKPLGKDRFHCKIWWFDGVGCMTLVSPEGEPQYGTGKIFIQGPSEEDVAIMEGKIQVDASIGLRREAEEGEAILGIGEWAWYETPDELDAYLGWLNPKGARENALEKAIVRWKSHIVGGMEVRLSDVEANNKLAENRRGSRKGLDLREPYMTYVNNFAKNNAQ